MSECQQGKDMGHKTTDTEKGKVYREPLLNISLDPADQTEKGDGTAG